MLALDYRALDIFARSMIKDELQEHVGIIVLGYNPNSNTLLIELKLKGVVL